MNEELDQVAELAGGFFAKFCAPHEARWGKQQHVDREVWTTAGQLGLLCASIPEEYDGGGGDFAHEAVIAIEQVRALAPSFGGVLHSGIIAHYINAYGTEEQKRAWLPKMASGEMIAAIAMTEPGTGSDLQNVKTRAVKEGDDYVINGAKTFISNGFLCDLVLVVAKTGDEGSIGDISLIGVETADLPGFSRGRNLEKVGQHGQDTCELNFENVRVPRSNLLGSDEGLGFVQLMHQLPQERLLLAVSAAATVEKAVQVTVDYARERTAFNKPLFAFQNTKFVLAECDTLASVCWSFLDDCVEKHLKSELDITTAAKAKWWLTEQQCTVVDRCVQVFGGYGYMTEYPIARMYADSRIQKIYGGTSEIMKELISRSL
ncbi:acyl-CoA dehydrogenase [Nocardia uniformis]|uniref:Acyl-[acyl-carrier-protein] dehydrogenase MbtN n=2 Tax=Nocardia uniformis TaxID=53432 RepID=A0A849BX83_9NOCA|nr:acyl-CoA dehydrogenase family protein [Nocardia uniformis]NNH71193.1 acyl-CoA dehydrogenase [Nocardia uniformis]